MDPLYVYQLNRAFQTMVGNAPQVALGTEAPLVHPDDNSPKETVIGRRGSKGGSRFRRIWVAIITLIGMVALSLGCGLGIGLRRDPTSTNPTPITVPTPTTVVPPPIQPTNGALNDTSLAAIQLATGDRHLFFQDINGTLRHAVFSKAFNKWLEYVDFIIPDRPPRCHTPLTTLDISTGVTSSDIFICYIDVNDTLVITGYSIDSGKNSIAGSSRSFMNDSFRVSTSARSLGGSVFRTNTSTGPIGPSPVLNALPDIVLFYVNPTNNITVLHGFFNSIEDFPMSTWVWQNISNTLSYPADVLSKPYNGPGWIGPPFSISNHDGEFDGYFFNPPSASDSTIVSIFSQISCVNLSVTGEVG